MKARFHNQKIQMENALLLQSTQEQEKKLTILAEQDRMRIIIIALVAIILLVVSFFALIQVNSKRRFRLMAHTDELTQLSNRRDIYVKGEGLLSDAQNQQQSIAVISFDADNFKQVNDRYGHDTGDKVLKTIAQIASAAIRDIDQLGRIGGEEFLIVLPDCSLSQAQQIARHLLVSIEKFEWQMIANDLEQTVSAGVVAIEKAPIEKDIASEFSALLVKADKALYKAKDKGRNCFQTYE